MYLFFDCETTGLPRNYQAPASDLENWPRLVQLAWQLYNEKHELVESKMLIIKPDGFTIPKQASDIHNVTQERAEREGVDITFSLNKFRDAMLKAKYLIAHNISFDEKIIGAEFIRMQIEKLPFKLEKIDTMHGSTDFCKIPGYYGKYKWPKLIELYEKLFDEGFEGAHDAMIDVKALARCFFELKKLNIL